MKAITGREVRLRSGSVGLDESKGDLRSSIPSWLIMPCKITDPRARIERRESMKTTVIAVSFLAGTTSAALAQQANPYASCMAEASPQFGSLMT
jgi:hypothetical protein